MGTVTGYTKEKMDEIADQTVVDGQVIGGSLVLATRGGESINAGPVIGPQGPPGTDPSIRIVTSATRPTTDLFNGLHIYETDTKRVYAYHGAVWYARGLVVCTSGSRPVVDLFTGLEIYESDTKRFFIYDGAAFIYKGGIWICTSSARPVGAWVGLAIYETDTKRLYIYDGATWIYRGGTFICTSATRPGLPFEGLEIYETDTFRKYIYSAAQWSQISGPAVWTAVTFTNGWGNVGAPRQAARFTKVNGIVHIQGQISGGVSGSKAFTLPAGYRPAAQIDLPSTDTIGVINLGIHANGDFVPGAAGSTARNINASFHI